jgi:hypothetical protein
MGRTYLLIVTALTEGGTGAALLTVPAVVISLLLGVTTAAPEAIVVGRITGGALMAVGIMCWSVRNHGPPAVLVAILAYDVAAAVALGVARVESGLVGIVLWPAVAAHVVLAVWCVAVLVGDRPHRSDGLPPG